MATADKYDRQLRLWGAHGQRSLMNAHILLINADSCGSETLKNLVLPGVGEFTVLDDFNVDYGRDLGCNFFVSEDCLGRPRAEVVTELLLEMNSDVKGNAKVASIQSILQKEPEYLKQFSLIIASNMPMQQLATLSSLCWDNMQPLVVLRSCGFVGYVRLQLHKHSIVESKVEADKFDLRIVNPFPALVDYCNSFDLSSADAANCMDSMQHAHIPYVVILFHALNHWKEKHEGQIPRSFAEKTAFKNDYVKAMARNYNTEINFQEAVREAYRAYTIKVPSCELQQLLENCERGSNSADQLTLTAQHSDFEFLTKALMLYMKQQQMTEGGDNCFLTLPHSGAIPDMTALTESYVQLQHIYQQQATAEQSSFKSILKDLLKRSGVSGVRLTDDNVIDNFCRNVHTVMELSTSLVCDEIDHKNLPEILGSMMNEVIVDEAYADPAQTPLFWYLALRASDKFFNKHGRWPGCYSTSQGTVPSMQLEEDQCMLLRELKDECDTLGISDLLDFTVTQCSDIAGKDDVQADESAEATSVPVKVAGHALEIVRYGGAEIHTTSAVVGGVAAQEVVKILTHQYVPLNSTYVFNGVASCGATYAF